MSDITPFYTSGYTGEEMDTILSQMAGDEYGEDITPGTRLVGKTSDMPQDLNELIIPGMYTAYFYVHGPKDLQKMNGTSPISISVFSSEDYEGTGKSSLWQTIITISYATSDIESVDIEAGSTLLYLFYRDISEDADVDITSSVNDYGWVKILLSNGNMSVINNLYSTDASAALSANMGRYLKYLIDQDNVGVANLLGSSGIKYSYGNDSTIFSTVWSDYSLKDGVYTTRDTNGGNDIFGLGFYINNNKYTNVRLFNPVLYFDNYINRDYLEISTMGIATDDTTYYGFRLNSDFEVPVNASDKAFTASFWAMNVSASNLDPSIYLEIRLCDSNHNLLSTNKLTITEDMGQTLDSGAEGDTGTINMSDEYYSYDTVVVSAASLTPNQWTRISATITGVDKFIEDGKEKGYDVRYVMMHFGIMGEGQVRFSNLKLERGKIATDATLSLAEMWAEFDNANFIRSIPVDSSVDIDSIEDGQGLIYQSETNEDGTSNGKWIKKFIATGGGGGFVVQNTPPINTEVLWYVHGTDNATGYCTSTSGTGVTLYHYEDAFYFYDKTGYSGAGWYPAEYNYTVGDNPPGNTRKMWLNTNNGKYSSTESPDLNYYDPNTKTWRIVGSEARPCWVIQDEEPTGADADLMWITTSGIASVPYKKPGTDTTIWLPIQAIWGNND